MFQNPVVCTDHCRPYVAVSRSDGVPLMKYYSVTLFNTMAPYFWHKLPSDFETVLFKLPPPQYPTTVQTRCHAPRSACTECVTVVLFAIAPPRGPYCWRKLSHLHGQALQQQAMHCVAALSRIVLTTPPLLVLE